MLPPNRRWRNGYGGGRWRRSGTMGWVVSEQSGEVEWPLVSRSDDAGEDLLGVGAAARRQVREDRGAGASRGRQPTEGPVEQQGDDFVPSTRPRRSAVFGRSRPRAVRHGRRKVARTVAHRRRSARHVCPLIRPTNSHTPRRNAVRQTWWMTSTPMRCLICVIRIG